MNVERLHLIAFELHDDLARSGLVQHLNTLADALQTLSSSPGEASYQQQVTSARESVREAARTSGIDEWPAAWRATLEELGVDDLVGSNLIDRVERAISSNEITATTAATTVRELSQELATADTSFTEMIAVFQRFGIAAEELALGDAEVAVTIPRGEVSERLQDLGREFERLNKILGVFVEIETGSREPMRVRSIASSDYGVYLETAVQVGAFIAISVERLLAGYKTILEIRTLRQGLADQGLEDQLGAVDERVNSLMDEKIREYVDEVVTQRLDKNNEGRANELQVELTQSLRAIANRIDHGYNFDVRASEEVADDDSSEGDPEIEEAKQRIVAASPNLKYINRTGQAILSLPEGSGKGDDTLSAD